MSKKFNEEMNKIIQEIISFDSNQKKEIIELLNLGLNISLTYLSEILEKEPIYNIRKIELGSIKKENRVDFGVIRTDCKLVFADWLFDTNLLKKIKGYLLYFLILKESLMHYIKIIKDEVYESIINIMAILWIKENFVFDSIDNPITATITSRIYSSTIGEVDYHYWKNFLFLLIAKDIDLLTLFKEFENYLDSCTSSQEEIYDIFSNWVLKQTIREENVISPIYLNQKLIRIIDTLVDLQYDKGSSSIIAKKLKTHENTIRKQYRDLFKHYTTMWRAVLNYNRLNLNNYFLKIKLEKNKIDKKLINSLIQIPYLKTLYSGWDSNYDYLYSPSLDCPHLISEQLNERLLKLQNKNSIVEYNLQMIREREIYGTITNYPYKPTIKNFKKFIDGDLEYIKKYKFSQEKRDFSLEFDLASISLDRNLLYFLSILQGKFLLRARFLVNSKELNNLCRLNNIDPTDITAQSKILNDLEARAKNKDLLDYSLYMRNFTLRGASVLITEIPTSDFTNEDELNEIIDSLRVFSFFAKLKLYGKVILTLPGTSHEHPIKSVIQETLENKGLNAVFYSVKLNQSKFVPLHELYDYDEQKWKI